MKKLFHLLLNFLIIFPFFLLNAQESDSITHKNVDPAQGIFSDIITNPAFTGIFYGHNLRSGASMNKPFYNFKTFFHPFSLNVSYNMAFSKNNNHAVGIFMDAEQGGVFQRKSLGLNYAYSQTLFMSKSFYHKLRVGASVVYHKLQYDNFRYYTFADMIDPKYGFVWNTSEYLLGTYYIDTLKTLSGLNFGFWYHNPYGFMGISSNYLSFRDTTLKGFNVRPKAYHISLGGHIYFNDTWALHPTLNIQYIPKYHKAMSDINPAITVSYFEKFYGGFSYQDFNKPTYMLGFTAKQKFSLFFRCGLYRLFSTDKGDIAFFDTQLNLKLR